MALGDYPIEYNPKVHGPYDPARYYGKPDTPFGEVKLGELGSWFARRNKSPQAVAGAVSRAMWRWQHKYLHPKRAGMAAFLHFSTSMMFIFYIFNYKRMQAHRRFEHH
ncbi:hypothetical protein O3M35_001873 [Rhynocoris fuscipes]|uniref:Mitochondrial ATP synthase F chain n=1 Tax=Rhynocoris fuscipes TaxID=488301 RepID=A0AAW1CRJ5_9HEMI